MDTIHSGRVFSRGFGGTRHAGVRQERRAARPLADALPVFPRFHTTPPLSPLVGGCAPNANTIAWSNAKEPDGTGWPGGVPEFGARR
jgi:hypothetical protein